MNWEHPLDNGRNSHAQGLVDEDLFDQYCSNIGWKSGNTGSGSDDDKYRHIDRVVTTSTGKVLKIQVKGYKQPLFWFNPETNIKEPLFPIELHGAMRDNLGWLYGGEMQGFAFGYKFSKDDDIRYLIIRRKKLIELVDRIILEKRLEFLSPRTESQISTLDERGFQRPRGAKYAYHFYNRRDYEVLLYLPFKEMKSAAKAVLGKNGIVTLSTL